MAQNSQRIQWSETEVDDKLKAIMSDCYALCFSTAKQFATAGEVLPSLVAGANIAGFLKVANAAEQ
jgi:glutamate dehydrogenase (NADP+)